MRYCEKCMSMTDGARCGVCGSKRLREAEADDAVLLDTQNFINAGILEGALQSEGVPFRIVPGFGAGITASWGVGVEYYRIYVLYRDYERCKAIREELLG